MTARANYAANEPLSGLVPVQSLGCSQVTKHRVEEGSWVITGLPLWPDINKTGQRQKSLEILLIVENDSVMDTSVGNKPGQNE